MKVLSLTSMIPLRYFDRAACLQVSDMRECIAREEKLKDHRDDINFPTCLVLLNKYDSESKILLS
jgi:hypothetical protein